MRIKNCDFNIFYFTVIFALFVLLQSCSPTTQSGYAPSTKTDNNNQNNSSDPVSPPSDVSTSNQFFVGVDTKTTYPSYMSQMTSLGVPQYNTKCAIDKSSTSHQNINCVMEAPELSLWYGGVQLALNIPAGMCEYLKEIPYWYYNKETGYGPTSITIEKTSRPNVASSFRCSVNGSALSTCSGYTEAYFKYQGDSVTEKCIYDTTGSNGGQNCCLGDYSFTQINISYDSSGVPSTSSSQEPRTWGTNVAACIGGQGKTNWDQTSLDGYPLPRITELRNGSKLKPVVIAAPSTSIHGQSSVIPVANYYTVSSTVVSSLHYHTGNGGLSGTSTNQPFFVRPISDRDGSPVIAGNPFYDFQCLDDHAEVKHRIKLYVRQWDVLAPFITYKNTGVYTGTAPWDYSGSEGSACDGITDPNEPCNDFQASDDIPRDLGGSYTGNSFYFFPNHQY